MYFLAWLCIWSFLFGKSEFLKIKDIMSHPNWKLLDKENCGSSNSVRIIGGKDASLGAYPWLVQIGYYTESESKLIYRCGGALINKVYILTAAHCVTDLPSGFKVGGVRIGEHNIETNPDCVKDYCSEPVQDIEAEKITVHEEYNKIPFKNDIAIIRLNKSVIFNENVRPICMIRDELLKKNFIGKTAEVAGWGIVDINDRRPSVVLQTVTLPVVQLEKCQKEFEDFVKLGQGQICVGGKSGQDSCGGDSGGPLMKVEAVDGPPKYYLIGIVSFGAKHCGSNAPAVYTCASKYITWILDQLKP